MQHRYLTIALFLILAGGLLSSCGSVKYSQMLMLDKVESGDSIVFAKIPSLKIRTDDILSIQVASRNPEAVIAFQQQFAAGGDTRASAGEAALGLQAGYRVDEEGNIYLPFIGAVEAAGKTNAQLRHDITDSLKAYFVDASVQVRFMNFRVTILGEVFRPSTYIIPNERLTILEAIGMAGDFTPYADRSNVLVIRERDEEPIYARINTQEDSLFSSSYFYLSPNDIVYIEPLRAKQYATQGDFVQRYSVVLVPFVSFVIVALGNLLLSP